MFAKLYETEIGQILVKMDSNPEGEPEVRIYFEPRALGVCSLAVSFEESNDGYDKQEAYFNAMTQEISLKHVKDIIKTTIGEAFQ